MCVQPEMLGLAGISPGTMSDPVRALRHVVLCRSPTAKMTLLSNGVEQLVKQHTQSVAADELLLMLTYLVIHADVPNWCAQSAYMVRCHAAQTADGKMKYFVVRPATPPFVHDCIILSLLMSSFLSFVPFYFCVVLSMSSFVFLFLGLASC